MSAPTQPGWWWRGWRNGVSHVVRVDLDVASDCLVWGPSCYPVCADGLWICEVPTPKRIAADAERLERVTQTVATEIAEAASLFEHSRSEYHRGVHNGLVMVRAAFDGGAS